ncbi:hypothetical protein B0H94_1169 [Salsuginibacillus halophilus]|uniref:DUF456 family protein n=1 Tax=Salsuginibacillus halophilus TaxID=517424 RepID=A0A2P8H800_9BACI|nr:DUF456 domain-containing protein [Salsuginibacillus halophilus]PSL42310.1 hypothetical protein B0H94_1169 [Salsuginibacillus halophilus]
MEWLWLVLAVLFYGGAWLGLIYPIVPSGLMYILAALATAGYFGFSDVGIIFYFVHAVLIILLFLIDHLISILGIQRSGGSKYAVWGSLAGALIGPFIIPVFGLFVGLAVGAVAGELFAGTKEWQKIGKVGAASLIGFVVGVIVKSILLITGLLHVFFFL